MRGCRVNSGALEVKQVIKRSHLRDKDRGMKQPKAIRYVFQISSNNVPDPCFCIIQIIEAKPSPVMRQRFTWVSIITFT